ncbi:T6SS phospholipase effector Tle1-like catalytic domain-containing protein [Pseudomonas sp. 5P_3.1_Bac2]|uniref:T6SS phospholipase effector Tle1-like catalytic domain-containing protein n=1 Tax=Pseudomonas sp. 5P_3.1_Bac2 TaxID=2971617 RepID=UPI0021CA2D94|nr:DUF2235 domain-containing protein [Pseudomonas sp. 5P_3.1_Bac2]MCU1718989.1 DUF2235 domain-containing protein [Pseudomonas sp. 5P_3.1_Bac2]
MSQAMSPQCTTASSSVLIAPPFTRSGLPLDSGEVATNIRLQTRDERKYRGAIATSAAKNGEQAPAPCCKTLHLSLCFDGTNNHEPSDKLDPLCTSNVARLFHTSINKPEIGLFSYYSPGVGTVFEDIKEYLPSNAGLIGAQGGENRINWGLTRLIDCLKKTLKDSGQAPLSFDQTYALVEAMSTNWTVNTISGGLLSNGSRKREAAIRPYEQELKTVLEQRKTAQEKPEILALRLYVYGFSRGAAQARTFSNWLADLTRTQGPNGTEYRFAGLPLSIEFLGLFDTVAAVGLADSAPFAAGHMSWADDTMRLPDESDLQACMPTGLPEDQLFLKRCVHLVSAHEQRASFPLDSIRRREKTADGKRDKSKPSSYRAGTQEFVYPGMHSDVGGGYPSKDQGKAMGGPSEIMSQVPLHHMYREAFKAGAPLQVPDSVIGQYESWRVMDELTKNEFDISETLITRFNAWQKQAKPAPLEDVMKRETALLTAWRIDRYAGGIEKQPFYNNVRGKDMPDEQQEAYKRLHARKLKENTAAREGKPLPEMTATQQAQYEKDLQTIGGEAAYQRINISKTFEPGMDDQQLRRAAAEFRRDYKREWDWLEDTGSVGGIVNLLLGGTVYLINEEDEAQEYASISQDGDASYKKLFVSGTPAPGQENLIKFFDEHVHDSRAWFMNSSGLDEREPFTDYFRYRVVHFDNESNKRLSVLATAGRVVGLGLALASVGLSIKRRDPKFLLGLIIPSLGTPVLTGTPKLPVISAFDPLTGIALPMQQGLEALRAFTQNPGDVVRQISSLPPPQPLTAQTATTPALQNVLQAIKAKEALQAAKDSGDMSGLLDQAVAVLGDAKSDSAASANKTSWMDKLADTVNEGLNS